MYLIEGTKPFAFIAHPRTGSQSFRAVFREHCVAGHHGINEAICARTLDAGGIVACVVRNPWDVVASWYYYQHVHPKAGQGVMPFDEWLQRALDGKQGTASRFLSDRLFFGRHLCSHIIRHENGFNQRLNSLLDSCGIARVGLPLKGKTDHPPRCDLYSDWSRAEVAKRFEFDVEANWYNF